MGNRASPIFSYSKYPSSIKNITPFAEALAQLKDEDRELLWKFFNSLTNNTLQYFPNKREG